MKNLFFVLAIALIVQIVTGCGVEKAPGDRSSHRSFFNKPEQSGKECIPRICTAILQGPVPAQQVYVCNLEGVWDSVPLLTAALQGLGYTTYIGGPLRCWLPTK